MLLVLSLLLATSCTQTQGECSGESEGIGGGLFIDVQPAERFEICAATNHTLQVHGSYDVKRLTCHRLNRTNVVNEYTYWISSKACGEDDCCSIVGAPQATCSNSSLNITTKMTIQCCCDAAKTGSGLEVVAGEPVSCDELRPRVEGKIEEQNIMDLTDATREQIASRLREGEDLEDLVTIKRVAMEVSDVEINCREGYRLSRDGQTCEECVRDSMFCRSSEDAEVCSSHGECECGECQCQEGWQGRFCDCTTEICPSDESGRICSEHGDCILQNCSQPRCECHHRWYGDLCECSDVRCPRGTNGWMCSSRGTCTCGRCDCPEGILGLACESCRQIEDIPGRVVLTGGPGAQYTDCFYTCSPRSTNRVLVKVVAVGRHCKSADVTISSGRCNNKTDSSSLCNDESVFYLSTSNCLCFTFRRPVGLKVELKFASHDGRLAPLVDFLFKNNMLEEYAMDADGWSRLELILLYPSRADTTRSTKPFFDMLPKVYQDLLKSFK